jgi:hypothetical protein
MKVVGTPPSGSFLAIYGWPFQGTANPAEASERPVGGGLGRNFGFGQNMLFQAGSSVGSKLKIELLSGAVISESCDAYIGGTLMSNQTGKENPLGFGIEFADFQCNKATNAKAEVVLTPAYADTQDQKWITEICPNTEKTKCRVDPLLSAEKEENLNLVKIEHVAIDIGPGLTVQGVVWGQWKNGAAGVRPCMKLKLPPKEASEKLQDQTLVVTKSPTGTPAVGSKITGIEGEACLISANNAWYSQAEKSEPAIIITNE